MFVSAELRSRVARLLAQGLSHAEIARRLDIAGNTVAYHHDRIAKDNPSPAGDSATKATSPVRAQERRRTDPPIPTREKVRALLEAGWSRVEAARHLALAKSTISYHARRLEMEMDATVARRFDWAAVQRYHDRGHSLAECRAKFGFSASAWCGAVRRGALVPRPRSMPIAELLARPRGRGHLKRRLLEAGLLPRRCEECGISEWRGRSLSLELHHVNGRGRDNRLENLQMLCPNCHSQTGSWGGRNGKPRPFP
jgi:hypothetical protein